MARTILLADDSMTIQKVVELTFMDQDYEVVAVSDGTAALERLDALSPNLVIADVHMPGVDGYEVCRQTKERRPDIPVLLLVGTFEDFDEVKAQEVGADADLKKPFDSQELLSEVERLVNASSASDAPTAPVAPTAPAAPEISAPEAPGIPMPSPIALPESSPMATVPLDHETVPATPVPEPAPEPVLEPEPILEEVAIDDVEPTAVTEVSAPEVPTLEASTPEAPAPEAPAEAASSESPADGSDLSNQGLSEQDVERIARRVVELLSPESLREVAWEVVPDLAEVIIKERIGELERQVESI